MTQTNNSRGCIEVVAGQKGGMGTSSRTDYGDRNGSLSLQKGLGGLYGFQLQRLGRW